MALGSQVDAIFGRMNDLESAIAALQAQANQLAADAAAIQMANTSAIVAAVSSALNSPLAALQAAHAELNDVNQAPST